MRKVQKQTKEVAMRNPTVTIIPPVGANVADTMLMALANNKDFDADKLEKLIALKNSEQARMAKEDFERNFQLMQAEYPVLNKRKTGTAIFPFCPLDVVDRNISPLMNKYHFSRRWENEAVGVNRVKVTSIIFGYGHEQRSSIEMPITEPQTKATNAMQQEGISDSYGQRRSFVANLGLVIAGEDKDGNGGGAAHQNPIADAQFKEILKFYPSEKQGHIQEVWDATPSAELSTVFRNIRGDAFVASCDGLPPLKIKELTGKWGTCKKTDEFLAVLSEAGKK
jgi:hypothetical protein